MGDSMKFSTLLCLIASVLLLTSLAKAHPADDACTGNDNSTHGCQPLYTRGNLKDPAFFAKHRTYWHHRRELNATIVRYAQCLGRVQERELVKYGQVLSYGSPDILTYWDVIPAHPVLDEGTIEFADASIEAAIATDSIFGVHVWLCNWYLESLRY
jgi:hypothetical protein